MPSSPLSLTLPLTLPLTLVAPLLLLAAAPLLLASAQSPSAAGCLSLKGSSACPSFQNVWVNPANLTAHYRFFSNVTDVASFDYNFELYLSDPNQFHEQKFVSELQCDHAQNSTLRWSRTVLCGIFSQQSYSASCNVANAAEPVMVCQDTCVEYNESEKMLLANPQICAPVTASQNVTRYTQLSNDVAICTNWTTPTSTDPAKCVEGVENEGNCGFGTSLDELCAYCDPSGNQTVSSCCVDQKTNLSSCALFGHPAAAAIRPQTSVAATPGSTGGPLASAAPSSSSTGLSSNTEAGIIVGVILGVALFAAIGVLLFYIRRRWREGERDDDAEHSSIDPQIALVDPAAASSTAITNAQKHSNADSSEAASPPSAVGSASPAEKFAHVAAAVAGTSAGATVLARRTSDRRRSVAGISSPGGNTDGRGTTIPQVRDQNSSHSIRPGDTVVSMYPYQANLSDELTLEPDQAIVVQRLFDDGWAIGRRIPSGAEGAFPLVCVTSAATESSESMAEAETDGYADGTLAGERTDDGAVTAEEFPPSDVEAGASRR